jgi:hypothetical protein
MGFYHLYKSEEAVRCWDLLAPNKVGVYKFTSWLWPIESAWKFLFNERRTWKMDKPVVSSAKLGSSLIYRFWESILSLTGPICVPIWPDPYSETRIQSYNFVIYNYNASVVVG